MCVGGQGSPACNVRIACCSAVLSCDVVNLLSSASSVFAKDIAIGLGCRREVMVVLGPRCVAQVALESVYAEHR